LPIASLTFGDALPLGSAANPLFDRVDLRLGTADIFAWNAVIVGIHGPQAAEAILETMRQLQQARAAKKG
jgi:hypothetical protein